MQNFFKQSLLTLILVSAIQITYAANLDHIVAIVNDSVITESQLKAQLQTTRAQLQAIHAPMPAPATLQKQVLQSLIDNELQLQLAKKMGMQVDDKTLTQAITDIATRNHLSLPELQEKLHEQGLSYDKYRNEIRQQILISQLQEKQLGPKISVTEQEVADMLSKMPKQSSQPLSDQAATYHIEDIYIPLADNTTPPQIAAAVQRAQTLLSQSQMGKSFAQLAKEAHADAPLQGGDLGWRKRDELPSIFVDAIKNAKPGQVIGPIKAPNGIHLIKLIAMRGAAPLASNVVTSYRVRHILIKTNPLTNDAQAKTRLIELRADILRGGDFAKLAAQYSQDPGSAIKGGDIGWITDDMVDPRFAGVMDNLKPGQISEPFKSQFGWHIAQILERKVTNDAKAQRLNQARELVYQRKTHEALQSWLRQLRGQAYIKIVNDN